MNSIVLKFSRRKRKSDLQKPNWDGENSRNRHRRRSKNKKRLGRAMERVWVSALKTRAGEGMRLAWCSSKTLRNGARLASTFCLLCACVDSTFAWESQRCADVVACWFLFHVVDSSLCGRHIVFQFFEILAPSFFSLCCFLSSPKNPFSNFVVSPPFCLCVRASHFHAAGYQAPVANFSRMNQQPNWTAILFWVKFFTRCDSVLPYLPPKLLTNSLASWVHYSNLEFSVSYFSLFCRYFECIC